MWYIPTMEGYLAVEKSEIMVFEGEYMELEKKIPSKINQTPQRQIVYVLSYI